MLATGRQFGAGLPGSCRLLFYGMGASFAIIEVYDGTDQAAPF